MTTFFSFLLKLLPTGRHWGFLSSSPPRLFIQENTRPLFHLGDTALVHSPQGDLPLVQSPGPSNSLSTEAGGPAPRDQPCFPLLGEGRAGFGIQAAAAQTRGGGGGPPMQSLLGRWGQERQGLSTTALEGMVRPLRLWAHTDSGEPRPRQSRI